MAGEWITKSIDELKAPFAGAIAIGPFGSRMKSDCYVSQGVPVIRGNNISDTRALKGELVFVSELFADSLGNAIVHADDLVFPHRGAIGLVGIVPHDENRRYVLSTSLMKLTCDRKKVDPLYLFYFFRSAVGRHELLKNASTVGTPGIGQPLTSLRAIKATLPPLPEQKRIADILGSLDDKIELNRKMNETLEAMARTIFKSWFVDFDPVVARSKGRQPEGMDAETAKLFPDSFEDSEIGRIPKGWKAGTINDLATLSRNTIVPLQYPDEVFDHYSIPAFDEGRVPKTEMGKTIMSNKFTVHDNCVLLSKLNPRIPRVWMPDRLDNKRALCSTKFLVSIPKKNVSKDYLYLLFTSPQFCERFATFVTGTSGSHQRVKPESLLMIETPLPPERLVRAFTVKVSPLLATTGSNIRQTHELAEIRNALLPRLLSGD